MKSTVMLIITVLLLSSCAVAEYDRHCDDGFVIGANKTKLCRRDMRDFEHDLLMRDMEQEAEIRYIEDAIIEAEIEAEIGGTY